VKSVGKDILYFEVGADNAPTLRVAPGEEFEVETQVNRGLYPPGSAEEAALVARVRGGNPSSGCVFVEGAEPGQVLAVEIGAFDLDELGYTAFSGSTGAMPAYFGASGVGAHHKQVRIADGFIHWSNSLRLPVEPMLGFVGTAPRYERIHNGWAGAHGGNFDVQEVTTGATVYLPVEVPGALLQVGDMHARQGDGEICGAGGIEASGRVRLKVGLRERPKSWRGPRIENATHIAAVAFAKPAEDAFRAALEAMVLWLEDDYGFARGEAYLFLGQVLEARCTAFVNPSFSYIAKVAKRWLPR
jgi:amidase